MPDLSAKRGFGIDLGGSEKMLQIFEGVLRKAGSSGERGRLIISFGVGVSWVLVPVPWGLGPGKVKAKLFLANLENI